MMPTLKVQQRCRLSLQASQVPKMMSQIVEENHRQKVSPRPPFKGSLTFAICNSRDTPSGH